MGGLCQLSESIKKLSNFSMLIRCMLMQLLTLARNYYATRGESSSGRRKSVPLEWIGVQKILAVHLYTYSPAGASKFNLYTHIAAHMCMYVCIQATLYIWNLSEWRKWPGRRVESTPRVHHAARGLLFLTFTPRSSITGRVGR